MKLNNFTIDNFSDKEILTRFEEGLFSEEFTLKDLDISARVLQYWSEKGLLVDKGRMEDENHKFTFVELVWLKMILELRKLGYPLKLIEKTKKLLLTKRPFTEFLPLKEDADNKIIANISSFKLSALNMLIEKFITTRQNINFIFFNTGDVIPVVDNDSIDGELDHLLNTESYISIPLFKLILNFINDERKYNFVSKSQIYNLEEFLILEKVRNGNFDSITIHFKNKQPVFIEGTKKEKINKEARLNEIFLERGYEKIEVKSQDGDITYSAKTTKYKL